MSTASVDGTDRGRSRVRELAVCALLMGLAFIQDPGYLTGDTKFDLVVDPGRYLTRALHLWDPSAGFGQLQNQAYGYLWPMGPFFVLGHVSGIPEWALQRLWLALVLCVAFLGAARLARALGVRRDLACLLVGVAYATSPRMMSTLGPISIEDWPSALAPWVLLPLVLGAGRMPPRRAAALSAFAVAMVGGVNATATFAVLPLGVVWLLTRTPGPRRRQLMLWWPPLVLLGTVWWLVPLLTLGGYSPPFLDFIESAALTTFPTTLFDVLRGTSDWVPYIEVASRAGNDMIRTPYLALDSGAVLLLGFAGLMHRRTPHRLFLVLSLVLGLLLVSAGHGGAVHGPFAADVRGLLDGVLSPLRNVHKFDPVVRLPLLIGLGALVDHVLDRWPARGRTPEEEVQASLDRFNRRFLVGVTLLVVAAAATPLVRGRIPPTDPVQSVPTYWSQTARWLHQHDDGGTALLAPGSSFATYLWGSPQDEPMEYLEGGRWAVRSAIPYAPTGNIRMLDEVVERLSQGAPSPHLAAYLARAGVHYLVVRNDLRQTGDVPDPVLVQQAVLGSPGLRRVASFGPLVGAGAYFTQHGARVVVNGGWRQSLPAVEVFEVEGGSRAASTVSTAPPVVVGGPEDLLDLMDLGLLGTSPAVLAADLPAAAERSSPGPVVLSDGLRDRERSFGQIHDSVSPVLAPGDALRSDRPAHDYQLGSERWRTTADYEDARAVSASSSASDANASGGARRGELPYAALDGSTSTAWASGPQTSGRAWWQVDLDGDTVVSSVRLVGGAAAAVNQTVRVRTSHGLSRAVALGPGEARTVRLVGSRPTSDVRVENAVAGPAPAISLAEVEIPAVDVTRRLVLPVLPRAWGDPEAIALRADRDARSGCATVGDDVRCVPNRQWPSEEEVSSARVVTLNRSQTYQPTLSVLPRAGVALERLALQGQLVDVSASSTAVPDPRASALAAVDGDAATTWLASATDAAPTLTVSWLAPHTLSTVSVTGSPDNAARRPRTLTLTGDDGSRRVTLDAAGRARFRPLRTTRLQVRVDVAEDVTDLGDPGAVGVGIGELRLDGDAGLPLALPTTVLRYPCGTGPTLELDGSLFATSVFASPQQLMSGRPVPARICRRASLAMHAGRNQLSFRSSAAFGFDSLSLTHGVGALAAATSVTVDTAGPATRRVTPSNDARVVELHQNVNAGWTASQAGHALRPVTLDGWQQGWVLAGRGAVTARFLPDRLYRGGLLLGLVCLLGLLFLALRWLRRPGPAVSALHDRAMGALPLVAVAAAASLLVAGVAGVVVAVLTAASVLALRRRAEAVLLWVMALPCLGAAAAYAVLPWGSAAGWAGDEGWPQYVMLVPLVAAVVASGSGVGSWPWVGSGSWLGRRVPKLFSRIAGRSTRR